MRRTVRCETYDWTGGYIKNNDSADEVRDIDLSTGHLPVRTTLWLPTQIFDFDIRPNAHGPTQLVTQGVVMPLSHDL